MTKDQLILVTGATGYIGGRLVPRLLAAGYRVRIMARDPTRLKGRKWFGQIEVAAGDVLVPHTLTDAMDGVDKAYYMVHSMRGGKDFHHRDVEGARNFGVAAQKADVAHIIYLGGLGDPSSDLSRHLTSRQETGEALRYGGVPVTEFRAAVVVGAGSISFEIIRYLVERLPAMICPSWVYTRTQPIAIDDLLDYLVSSLEITECIGKNIEIGGADVLTYGEMMLDYAKTRGLRRKLFSVPVLTPRLSSYWVHWVTPISSTVVRPLIDGLRNEAVVRDLQSENIFPNILPMGYIPAVNMALEDLRIGRIETAWSDALWRSTEEITPLRSVVRSGLLLEQRTRKVSAPVRSVYKCYAGIGGRRGWYHAAILWQLRGWIDRLLGGVGLRRGRRHPDDLRVGDALDFWRVEHVEKDHLLRLRAEMKLPGKAWLQFKSTPQSGYTSLLEMDVIYAPKGILGLIYWYSLYPIHRWIFNGLVHQIAKRAEKSNADFPDGTNACL
jgi:uncharacterized protein YbjT (DUF2867 family)